MYVCVCVGERERERERERRYKLVCLTDCVAVAKGARCSVNGNELFEKHLQRSDGHNVKTDSGSKFFIRF